MWVEPSVGDCARFSANYIRQDDMSAERSQCATRNDQRIGLVRFRVGVGAQFKQNLLSCSAFRNSFVAESFGEGHIETVFLKKDLQSFGVDGGIVSSHGHTLCLR